MFSDEFSFSLNTEFRWITVWRRRGTRFHLRSITELHKDYITENLVVSRSSDEWPNTPPYLWTAVCYCFNVQRHKYLSLMFACFEVVSVLDSHSGMTPRLAIVRSWWTTPLKGNISVACSIQFTLLILILYWADMLGRQLASLSHPPYSRIETNFP